VNILSYDDRLNRLCLPILKLHRLQLDLIAWSGVCRFT